MLRDYILSLGGVAEDGHVASPAPPLARTGNLSSMGSSKMDPVRPPAEALKSPLSGQFSSLVQNLPTRINSETLSPGLEQLPQFTGDCGSVWRTVGLTPAEKLKTGHFTPEKETVGGATRAAGEVRQGSPLNWINQWAASHPSQHAESSGPVHFGAVPVSVPVPVEGSAGGTGVPMSDRVLHGMETEWVRLLAAVNGNETNPGASRTGALEALLPDANPKPLTSQAATEGNAVPSNVMSHQVPAAAGGFRQAERSPPRKRSVSDRAAMEDLLGLGRFSVTPAPHAVTSQYPVLSSGVSGMTSEVVQSGDPSLFLTDQRFPSPLSARGAWGTSPTASLPNQAGFTKPGANPHATGETDGFLRAPKQRRIAEDESSYAARATGLQKPGSLDSVKPAVSNENKVLVSLVTNHLRSLLDEQAAQLKVVGEGPGGQVVRLREQHVQVCKSDLITGFPRFHQVIHGWLEAVGMIKLV